MADFRAGQTRSPSVMFLSTQRKRQSLSKHSPVLPFVLHVWPVTTHTCEICLHWSLQAGCGGEVLKKHHGWEQGWWSTLAGLASQPYGEIRVEGRQMPTDLLEIFSVPIVNVSFVWVGIKRISRGDFRIILSWIQSLQHRIHSWLWMWSCWLLGTWKQAEWSSCPPGIYRQVSRTLVT